MGWVLLLLSKHHKLLSQAKFMTGSPSNKGHLTQRSIGYLAISIYTVGQKERGVNEKTCAGYKERGGGQCVQYQRK